MRLYCIYPRAHRTGITEVDENPSDPTGAIDARKYHICRFDITIAGENFTSLTGSPLFWDRVSGLWQTTPEQMVFTSVGNHVFVLEDGSLGIMFLKVTLFSGTSFSFSADYVLG